MRGVEPFGDAGERLQIVGGQTESWRGEQPHERGAVGVVAYDVQQGEDVFDFGTFQECGLAETSVVRPACSSASS